jgi:DNA topoisomerase-3
METSGRTIDDEQLREAMRGRGLGTPATRASILETLLTRAYVQRDKKALRVTDLGRYLIAIIADPMLKSAELTGEWEWKLGEIERGRFARTTFVQEIVDRIRTLVATGLSPRNEHPGLGPCPRCRAEVIEGREAYGLLALARGLRVPPAEGLARGGPAARAGARSVVPRGAPAAGGGRRGAAHPVPHSDR